MTDKRQHFFIYERKEMFILFALGSLIAIFAFTLGVHLGKKQSLDQHLGMQNGAHGNNPIETQPDEIPNNLEMSEQIKDAPGAAVDSLNQELQNEVAETGIKMEKKIQVDLPQTVKTPQAKQKTETPQAKSEAFNRKAPAGRFTLQIGSYSSSHEAEARVKDLSDQGLEPFLREANIRGKGHWFRIYIGGYPSVKDAKNKGSSFVQAGKIQTFVVAPMPGV